jgi:hypothetical protein
MECGLLEWMKACRGMGVPIDGIFLSTLIFADDQVLTAQDEI